VFARRESKRKILNPSELLKTVQLERGPLGNVEVEVHDVKQGSLSFEKQVTLLHDAAIFIGIHGADLTNCLFLPHGSVLIEVNPWHWFDERFLKACEIAGVHYLSYNDGMKTDYPWAHYPTLTCPAITSPATKCDYGSKEIARERDVTVDVTKFRAILQEAYSKLGWINGHIVYPTFEAEWHAVGRTASMVGNQPRTAHTNSKF